MKSLLRNHILTGKVCCSEALIIAQLNVKRNMLPFCCHGSTKRNEVNGRPWKVIINLKTSCWINDTNV